MLVRDAKPITNTSPFYFKGTGDNKQDQVTVKPTENNRERVFRRAGNVCELAAGVALNSTIIFTFHLLQVNPVGLFLAVGTAHFYFTATAIGEKSFPVAMVGGAASLSCLCALSEPIGEFVESRISIKAANDLIAKIENQRSPDLPIGLIIALVILGVKISISRLKIRKV